MPAVQKRRFNKSFMMYVLLILGFVLLIKGADYFVDGASSVAKLLKIPSVIIGLTIAAIGTSAPEAAVSISAGLSGNSDIALSNVVGSNMFNLLVVLGVSAVICPMMSDQSILKRDIWWSLGATAAVFVMMLDMKISRVEGILLLCGLVTYLVILVRSALKNRTEGEEVKTMSPLKSVICIIGGLAAVAIGGDLVVDNAVLIAQTLGMSETFIGLTIIAMGTSLPELVTSIVAAKKGDSGLALGNVVGAACGRGDYCCFHPCGLRFRQNRQQNHPLGGCSLPCNLRGVCGVHYNKINFYEGGIRKVPLFALRGRFDAAQRCK